MAREFKVGDEVLVKARVVSKDCGDQTWELKDGVPTERHGVFEHPALNLELIGAPAGHALPERMVVANLTAEQEEADKPAAVIKPVKDLVL